MAFTAILFALLAIRGVIAVPVHAAAEARAAAAVKAGPAAVASVTLNGVTYLNKVCIALRRSFRVGLRAKLMDVQGLVAFGLIPSDFKDSTGRLLFPTFAIPH